ncbi:MAG: FAD-dependent monooxygenase [Burkholderiaceae bacterium]
MSASPVSLNAASPVPAHVPVLITGGGPVGFTLAALLAKFGVPCLVVEADAGYCTGSRAICVSRRSQEILGWVGADAPLVQKGLSWVGGRSYYRDTEVLHFEMPWEPTQRFAPMVNIQQYFVEQFAHEAIARGAVPGDVRWNTRLVALEHEAQCVVAQVESAAGLQSIRADWLVACDGGRSTVRELLGLQLQGMQYEGKYVIVDVRQKTRRAVERLAWFDPPSNPGSTILMHRQPDDVWRIDYQIRADEDPLEAVRPENVLPRVQSHLAMIGEDAPWEVLWITIYNAKCLTLDSYRHGRVLFAGDAAHLVPIFGVRGLNSGLDDAGNMAWKLARVLQGESGEWLLESYSSERVPAARENMAYGAKSTEFMAPPDFAFELMRQATLRLALTDPSVRSLINPRQSVPIRYADSPLNLAGDSSPWANNDAAPGAPAPDAQLEDGSHLSQHFGLAFVCLVFANVAPSGIGQLQAHGMRARLVPPVCTKAWQRYGLGLAGVQEALVLVRPDGYVMGRWDGMPLATMLAEFDRWRQQA